jgi:GNAT superfamily N-acetyltransferase
MTTVRCLCGEELSGTDDDALFLATRRHLDAAHADLGLSDARVRDWLAAQARPGWDGTHVTLTAPPEVRPLTPERLADFLAFFDRDAFQDNPTWASCYCYAYHFVGSGQEWNARTAAENRAAKSALIERGEAQGYLAYADGKPVGWCHAAPRGALAGLDATPEAGPEDGERVGAIVCFVIAAPYRRQGIATRLLDAACDGLRAEGMTVAEAYPARQPDTDARAYHGPLAMYLAAGFTAHHEGEQTIAVRKSLTDASA